MNAAAAITLESTSVDGCASSEGGLLNTLSSMQGLVEPRAALMTTCPTSHVATKVGVPVPLKINVQRGAAPLEKTSGESEYGYALEFQNVRALTPES
ncbi:MAG: hypothetical protein ACLQD9_06745 [Thermoplasmata archaeon]